MMASRVSPVVSPVVLLLLLLRLWPWPCWRGGPLGCGLDILVVDSWRKKFGDGAEA